MVEGCCLRCCNYMQTAIKDENDGPKLIRAMIEWKRAFDQLDELAKVIEGLVAACRASIKTF